LERFLTARKRAIFPVKGERRGGSHIEKNPPTLTEKKSPVVVRILGACRFLWGRIRGYFSTGKLLRGKIRKRSGRDKRVTGLLIRRWSARGILLRNEKNRVRVKRTRGDSLTCAVRNEQ